MRKVEYLSAMLLTGLTIVAHAAPLLVEDGAPRAALVVPPAALTPLPAPEKGKPAPVKPQALRAAEELQTYIEKISGAKLPIIAEGAALPAGLTTTLLIGHTQTAAQLGVAIPKGYDPAVRPDAFNEEGFILKTQGNQLIVAGNEDHVYQGTMYAAYALLESLGCRWYFPGAWGEVVPQQKTIALPTLDITRRPDFTVRSIGLSGWVPVTKQDREDYAVWETRVGFSGRAQFYPTVGDGFLGFLVPPAEYFEKHPEWYALDETGKRHAAKRANGPYMDRETMLCLSNPEMYAQAVANLQAAFAGTKPSRIVTPNGFGISPPDGVPYCYCDACKAQSANFTYPQYVHRPSTSEQTFAFAARLAREFPDKYVSTMAYALREFPPQGVDLPDNVMVLYAPIANDVLHPHNSKLWRHTEYLSMLKQYRRQTPHVLIYDYNPGFLAGNFVPERDGENMAVNMPLYKDIGIKGFQREGRKAFMQTWLSFYISAKLMWDAKADVNALKDDFYPTFFGSAAGPHVRAWWDACPDALAKTDLQAHEDWLVNHIYNLAFVEGLKKHVDAALAAEATPAQKDRLQAFALIADHLLAFAQMNAAEMNLDYAQASACAQRMTDAKQQLNAVSSFLIQLDEIKPPRKPRSFFPEGRKLKFDELQALTNGEKGTLIAPLPLEMKFTRDRFNAGVVMEWYAPKHDDSAWAKMNTFYLWDQQTPFEDEKGHDYDGYGWYRATFTIDPKFAGQPIHFWCGGISNEGWVWINGQYVGKKNHALWWMHPHDFDLDITTAAKPGENTITIRVLSDSELSGLYRRGFFYSPK